MWSNFSYKNQHKFVDAIARREFFTSSRSAAISSFCGYRSVYYCQTCKVYTAHYFVHTFATILYQECLECKSHFINVSTSVSTVSSKRHKGLLVRGIGDMTRATEKVMGPGERYLL